MHDKRFSSHHQDCSIQCVTGVFKYKTNSNWKVPNQKGKSKGQTHQTNDNNRHILDLVQAYIYVEND